MRKVLFISIILLTQCLTGQNQFIEEEVNQLLVEEVNKLREEKGLPVLIRNEVLEAAAFDQAEYILDLGKITHEQDQSKKKDLVARLLYYEGKFEQAGENAAMVTIGSKEQVTPGGERLEINTNLKGVKAAITSWLDEDEGRLNLLDPQFYTIGSAVVIDENEELIMVAVLASKPYVAPQGYKVTSNLYGINRYDKEACEDFLENYSSLPQLFSDALKVENGEVFFEYHSLAFVEEVLSSGGDAIAVDIVEDRQFDCGKGNQLYPTEIADGFLMIPSKKGKLNAFNLAKEEGKVKLSLGELPGFYDAKRAELNAIIIKDNHYCETIPFNRIETKNVKGFYQPYVFAGIQDTNVYSWRDSSVIEFSQNGNWEQELRDAFEQFNLLDYNYTAIDINQTISPIAEAIPEVRLRQLVKELSGTDISVWFKTTKAWSEYRAYEKGSFHELETKGMDSIAKIPYIDSVAKVDTAMSNFLSGLNRFELVVQGEASVSKEMSNAEKIKVVEFLAEQTKIQPALFLQVDLIKAVQKGQLKEGDIPITDPKQKKFTLPLINNQIILAALSGKNNYGGNSFYLAFLELHLIDKKQAEIKFNTYVSNLQYWAKSMRNIDNIDAFEDWEDQFIRLKNTGIPDSAFAKGMLNYFLIAADYYYEKEKFDKRKKAFDEIMKWQGKAQLSKKEVLDLAQYLCFQDQFPRAIELLKPFAAKESVDKDILFYFLQIAIYDQELVPQKKYFETLLKAEELYPDQFCSLFSKQKMGMQLLKHKEVKTIFCEKCK
ncbi:MAG: CAP domain-containing protein [Vicingaceae bacterium]